MKLKHFGLALFIVLGLLVAEIMPFLQVFDGVWDDLRQEGLGEETCLGFYCGGPFTESLLFALIVGGVVSAAVASCFSALKLLRSRKIEGGD